MFMMQQLEIEIVFKKCYSKNWPNVDSADTQKIKCACESQYSLWCESECWFPHVPHCWPNQWSCCSIPVDLVGQVFASVFESEDFHSDSNLTKLTLIKQILFCNLWCQTQKGERAMLWNRKVQLQFN